MSSSFMPFLPFRPCAHTTHFINSFIRAVIIIGGGVCFYYYYYCQCCCCCCYFCFCFLLLSYTFFEGKMLIFAVLFDWHDSRKYSQGQGLLTITLLRFYCWSLWFLCIVFLATLLFFAVVVVVALYSAWIGTLMTEGVHFWHVIVITSLPIRHA